MSSTRPRLLVVALLIAFASADLAAADPVPAVRLTFRTADLQTDAGAAKLLRRLETAAGVVCQENLLDSRSLALRSWLDACKRDAVARAVASLHSPVLAEAFRKRYHVVMPEKRLAQGELASPELDVELRK